VRNRAGGRRRPADAEFIISQVKSYFKERKDELGAKKAAEELGVGLASFYNYVSGKTLPDMRVLRKAHEKWGITWKHMDFSEIMPKRNIRTPEQLTLELLRKVSDDDIEVVLVGHEAPNSLRVALKIRFAS